MKLDPRCIRDLLITIEEKSTLDDNYVSKRISIYNLMDSDRLKDYSKKELIYTLKKLNEAYLVKAEFKYASNMLYDCWVTELTFQGHQFLSSISNSKVFEIVMTKIDEIGSGVTIDIIKALANKILKEKLGL